MHIHILGICGTFMGGVALLARAAGHTVTGCDANVYPPMSTQLEQQGIGLIEGYDTSQLDLEPDVYVVGNAVSRGIGSSPCGMSAAAWTMMSTVPKACTVASTSARQSA